MLFYSWKSGLNFLVFIFSGALALVSVYIYFFFLIPPWNSSLSNFPCFCLPAPFPFGFKYSLYIFLYLICLRDYLFQIPRYFLCHLEEVVKTSQEEKNFFKFWKLYEHLSFLVYLEQKASAVNKEKVWVETELRNKWSRGHSPCIKKYLLLQYYSQQGSFYS